MANKKRVVKSGKNNKISKKNNINVVSTKKERLNPWTLSIYVYWIIVLLFISATFYILGRSHNIKKINSNIEITEETLIKSDEYLKAGKEKLINGNLEEALIDFGSAIGENSVGVEAYILRGETYMQLSKYREALNDFTTALELDSLNAIAYYDRALLYIKLEDYPSALNDINNSLAARVARPSDVLQVRDIYAKRGQLNLWLKNYEGAIVDYTNSIARPEGTVNHNVYAERAEAYTALNKYSDAISDYATAIRIISEQIQAVVNIHEKEDLSRQALSYFEKSAALNLKIGEIELAKNDLNSAYTIATALDDKESVNRLSDFIQELR